MQKKELIGYLVLFMLFCVCGYLIYRQAYVTPDQKNISKTKTAILENTTYDNKAGNPSDVILSGIKITFPSDWKITKESDSAVTIVNMPGVKSSVKLSLIKCVDTGDFSCFGSGMNNFKKMADGGIYNLLSTDNVDRFGFDFGTDKPNLYEVDVDYGSYKYSAKDSDAMHNALMSATLVGSKNNTDISETNPSDSNPSDSDKDKLLDKLFPNLSFKNGKVETDIPGMPVTLSLKNSEEGYFVNNKEKDLLLTVELEGMAHVGGLYHAFLGLFDANGNLLTSPIKFTEDDWHNITPEDGHFGGDKGSFAFYDCKGIKYILSVAGGCPNGSCCDDSPNLYKIENGKFKNIEDGINIDGPASKNPWKVTTSGNRLIIKTVPKASDNDCMETDYKDLTWNGEDCRFE